MLLHTLYYLSYSYAYSGVENDNNTIFLKIINNTFVMFLININLGLTPMYSRNRILGLKRPKNKNLFLFFLFFFAGQMLHY